MKYQRTSGGIAGELQKPEDLLDEDSLLKHLTKLVVERAQDAEMTEHLWATESLAGPGQRRRTPVAGRDRVAQSGLQDIFIA